MGQEFREYVRLGCGGPDCSLVRNVYSRITYLKKDALYIYVMMMYPEHLKFRRPPLFRRCVRNGCMLSDGSWQNRPRNQTWKQAWSCCCCCFRIPWISVLGRFDQWLPRGKSRHLRSWSNIVRHSKCDHKPRLLQYICSPRGRRWHTHHFCPQSHPIVECASEGAWQKK